MSGSGDFSIGATVWPGLGKLIEECGEVQQVAGKLIGSHGASTHWDGTDLRDRLADELGDLLAAIGFVLAENGFEVSPFSDRIAERSATKITQFEAWHANARAEAERRA